LPWDSTFWDFPIGRVIGDDLTTERVHQIERWCRKQAITCLYFLARVDDPETITLAENHGFRLVDLRVTLRARLESAARSGALSRFLLSATPPPGVVLRASRLDDVPTLERIAAGSYHDSRFYFDSRFPRDRSDALYTLWIRQSCEGSADFVQVAEVNGEAAGYVTCHLDQQTRTGSIGLVGVGEGARGLGLGQAMIERSLAWFHEQGMAEASVVTQGRNLAAQRLYQRCGFLTADLRLWYHRWPPGRHTVRDE